MTKQLYTAVYIDNRNYNKCQYPIKCFGAESLQEAEALARRYESPLNGNTYLIAVCAAGKAVQYGKKVESNTKNITYIAFESL